MDQISQWELGTYFGLAAAVVAIVGALKKLFPVWVSGKEPHISLVMSYVLGVSVKLFVPDAYKSVHWVVFLLTLLVVAAGAKFGHDHIIDRIIKNEPTVQEKEGNKK